MSWIEIAFIYVLVWWLVIFAVLPFGIRHAQTPASGHPAGAPERPRVGLKLVVTSVLSAVVTAIVIYIMSLIGSPGAWAAENSPCATLPDYRSAPGVAYEPGVAADGTPVAPADLYHMPLSAENFGSIDIVPAIPLENYTDTSAYSVDLSDTRVSPGVLGVQKDGVTMNGTYLGAPGAALPCK